MQLTEKFLQAPVSEMDAGAFFIKISCLIGKTEYNQSVLVIIGNKLSNF